MASERDNKIVGVILHPHGTGTCAIAGGMVFQPLSQPLLEHYYGRHVASKAPPSLLAELSQFREHVDESIVVLSQVLHYTLLCMHPIAA